MVPGRDIKASEPSLLHFGGNGGNYITMDLEYLLFLQNFRNSINDALTPFMQFVTVFAVNYLIFFAVYYYWRVNKRDGLFTLVAYYICIAINPLIKLTACVYRPWIRDSRTACRRHGGCALEEYENALGISLLCHFCSSDGIFEKLSGSAHTPGCLRRTSDLGTQHLSGRKALCISGCASGE